MISILNHLKHKVIQREYLKPGSACYENLIRYGNYAN